VLTDADAIRNLLGRYCDLVDGADWDGVGELFADGALAADDGTVLATGAREVAEFYGRTVLLHEGSPRTKHLVANTVIDTDADRAVARSSYLVLQDLQPIITGRYVDRFERVDGSWSWRERRFAVDQVGDLSRHLAR